VEMLWTTAGCLSAPLWLWLRSMTQLIIVRAVSQ